MFCLLLSFSRLRLVSLAECLPMLTSILSFRHELPVDGVWVRAGFSHSGRSRLILYESHFISRLTSPPCCNLKTGCCLRHNKKKPATLEGMLNSENVASSYIDC